MNHRYLIALLLLVFNYTGVFAAENDAVGRIKTASGSASVTRGSETISAKPGMTVVKSDTLVTGKQSSLGIVFNDNSTLSLGSDTRFLLSHYEFNVLEKKAGFVGRIRHGSMIYLSGLIAKMNSDAARFETPVAVAGVKGTKLAIKVEGDDNE